MSRTLLAVALLGVVACHPDYSARPTDDDTFAADTPAADTAHETGLWVDTDTDVWLDTARDTDTAVVIETDAGCPIGFVLDCLGQCSAVSIQGDGFCDAGPSPKPDFGCVDFDFDGGDCVVDTEIDTDLCPFPGEVPDCNGNCFAGFLVGDDDCQQGPAPQVDFSCEAFTFDGGDCVPDTDTDVIDTDDTAVDTDALAVPCPGALEIRDCDATCWPEAWLGDARCDDGAVQPWGDPDFDCAYYERDRGDCPAVADTDTDVTGDTDVANDTDITGDTDVDTDVANDTDVTGDTDVANDTDVADTDVTASTDVPVETDVAIDTDTDVISPP